MTVGELRKVLAYPAEDAPIDIMADGEEARGDNLIVFRTKGSSERLELADTLCISDSPVGDYLPDYLPSGNAAILGSSDGQRLTVSLLRTLMAHLPDSAGILLFVNEDGALATECQLRFTMSKSAECDNQSLLLIGRSSRLP